MPLEWGCDERGLSARVNRWEGLCIRVTLSELRGSVRGGTVRWGGLGEAMNMRIAGPKLPIMRLFEHERRIGQHNGVYRYQFCSMDTNHL